MADRPIQIDVQKYLSGADYPVRRDDLLEMAKKQNAPGDVLSALEGLPDRDFESPVQVSEALSE